MTPLSTLLPALLLWSAPVADTTQATRAASEDHARIEVVATDMHNDVGRMMALLYDSSEGFPRDLDACADYRTAEIRDGRARTSFSELAPGTYAVLVIHDEDGDGYLKTNVLGMPKEGVGVSNNGKGMPRFKKAKFEVEAGATVRKRIVINYL